MKFIKKKLIKQEEYYYFEYGLRIDNKKYTFTKYLGLELPDNLKERMKSYFDDIAMFIIERSNLNDYFFKENYVHIEKAKFRYVLLNHELFTRELRLFRTLFYILFVLNSNRSEGSKITQNDIEKIMTRKIKPDTIIGKEILNSIEAINFSFSDEMKWNSKSIKKIHKLLFDEIYPMTAGKYKKVDNVVNNNPTTKWQDVSKEIKNLLEWLRINKKKMYPPQLALEFHWRFESIHPFEDGNGRVGRILLNSLLVETGYAPVIYFTDNHKSYCNALDLAIKGKKRQLAKHYIESIKKTEKAIERYQKEEIIEGGSFRVGKWQIQKGKIRLS